MAGAEGLPQSKHHHKLNALTCAFASRQDSNPHLTD